MDKFNQIPLPQTEFQNDMKDANRSPIEIWLEDFTRQNSHKDIVKLPSNEIYSLFNSWLITSKMNYDVNSIKFFVRLKNLN